MVRGLDLFRARFREFEGSFVLIGGAACDEWFTASGLVFRVTKDLDVVLIIELLAPEAIRALRIFIAEGGYEIRQRTEGSPVLYRFAKPRNEQFPFMLELFSRKPEGPSTGEEQEITPISAGADHHSLSAILPHEDYSLIQTHKDVRDGLPAANVTAHPPEGTCVARLDQTQGQWQEIDSKDIAKHRNDVFRPQNAAGRAWTPTSQYHYRRSRQLSPFIS
jgi:hypothetical protein